MIEKSRLHKQTLYLRPVSTSVSFSSEISLKSSSSISRIAKSTIQTLWIRAYLAIQKCIETGNLSIDPLESIYPNFSVDQRDKKINLSTIYCTVTSIYTPSFHGNIIHDSVICFCGSNLWHVNTESVYIRHGVADVGRECVRQRLDKDQFIRGLSKVCHPKLHLPNMSFK